MVAAADTAEGMLASKAGRALAFGYSFTACLLAAGVLAITLLGHPGGPATVSLELDSVGHGKAAIPQDHPAAAELQSITGPIHGPVFAGRALVADPALIENSKFGPLPRIADVAQGMTVMMDSGIRRGTDVIKAIALGADFVFAGRPFLYAAAIGQEAGVRRAIDLLRSEIHRNLAFLGSRDLSELNGRVMRIAR